jgi:hypothetical protein
MLRDLRPFALVPVLVALGAAGPPPMIQKAFGNTIVSTYPDNRQARLWLQPSGAYTAMGRRGDVTNGHWKIDGAKLCLKQDHPAIARLFSYCTPIPTSRSWTTKAVTGETIQVRLVKGGRKAAAG